MKLCQMKKTNITVVRTIYTDNVRSNGRPTLSVINDNEFRRLLTSIFQMYI